MRSRSINAASVIAAGSVMNEPRSGTSERLRKYPATAGCAGSSRATERTPSEATCMIGLLAATTMITKTNIGSTNFRLSR